MPARIERIAGRAIAGRLLAFLVPCVALAQTPESPIKWPTPLDIDHALKTHPFPAKERIKAQPIPQPPRVNPHRNTIDIEAIARSSAQLTNTGATSDHPTSALRIFITLDMPQASLQLLSDQASRVGATLVLRGLKSQSMRQTLARVGELIGTRKVAWVIDPQAFARFGVRQAPSFVLTLNDATGSTPDRSCGTGCPTPAGFVSVSGDVTLDYALETMLRRRPDAAPRVDPILKRLRAS